MPTAADMLQLTTLFSGGQLAVVVFILMKLDGMKSRLDDMKKDATAHDVALDQLNKDVAHLRGQMKAKDMHQ